jgi:feruloyl-CoA synthase
LYEAKFLSHFAPHAQDVVIAGHDRDYLSALNFPDVNASRQLGPADVVRSVFKDRLMRFAETSTGSSNRIVNAILLEDPPSTDAHEITDKGSLNQRSVLSNRAALVEELYAEERSSRVITINT